MRRFLAFLFLAACSRDVAAGSRGPVDGTGAEDAGKLGQGESDGVDLMNPDEANPHDTAIEVATDVATAEVSGKCQPATCDDGNPCTVDSCLQAVGCAHDPTNLCDDGNACTVDDVCAGGACLPGAVTACDDGNGCTTDSCVTTAGCTFTPNQAACPDDGNGCTADVCAGGKCAYPPTNEGTPCDDGTGCTQGDACSGGACTGKLAVWQKDWPQEGIWSLVTLAADAGGNGWLLMLHGAKAKLGKSQFVRVDAQGNVLWKQLVWVPLEQLVARQGGWAAQACATCACAGGGCPSEFIYFYDATGSQIAYQDTGLEVQAVKIASIGADVLLVTKPWDGVNGTHSFAVRRIAPDGKTVKSVLVPTPFVLDGAPDVALLPDSTIVLVANATNSGTGGFGMVRLGADLSLVKIGKAPFPDPLALNGGPMKALQVGALGGGNFYVAGDQSGGASPEKVHPILAPIDPKTGGTAWLLRLRWPELDATGMTGSRFVRLPSGDFEATAATNTPGLHFASWRFAADGTMRWRRLEDGRRQPQGKPAFAAGEGTVTAGNVLVQGALVIRLSRSDAFGNLSCAESGPCYDMTASGCEDGDPCTNDRCDALHGGCWHEPFGDGTPCSPAWTCSAGKCGP